MKAAWNRTRFFHYRILQHWIRNYDIFLYRESHCITDHYYLFAEKTTGTVYRTKQSTGRIGGVKDEAVKKERI